MTKLDNTAAALFEAEHGRPPRSREELDAWLDQPVAEQEAEEELFALKASEAIEQANERNPDLPPIPVAYPKNTRRRQ